MAVGYGQVRLLHLEYVVVIVSYISWSDSLTALIVSLQYYDAVLYTHVWYEAMVEVSYR